MISRQVAANLSEKYRQSDWVVGFTSGTFDLLTEGHVDYLQKARQICDVLFVGINSDASVKSYKGPNRPIVHESSRIKVISAMGCVDHCFLFDETKNKINIELLQPNIYIKAGDYTKEQLTSAGLVESYGGKVVLIPPVEGVSTTQIIEKIKTLSLKRPEPQKALVVDRDGTINKEVEYLHEPEKFELLVGAGEGLKKFQDMGYKIVVITTQAGIGLGYFQKEDFYKVNQAMFKALAPFDVHIDKIYFNTYSKEGKKDLFALAQQDLNLIPSGCVFIGDKSGDMIMCEEGIKIGVTTGHALRDGQHEYKIHALCGSILEAADWIEHGIISSSNKK